MTDPPGLPKTRAAPDCLLEHIVPELPGESLGWWLAENEAMESPAGKL